MLPNHHQKLGRAQVNCRSITHPAAVHQAIAATILQQGEATYEVHNVKKDSTPFWCQATTSLFEHPDYGTVLVAVQQDITERKQATEQLQQVSDRLALAVKSGGIGTWDWNVVDNSLTWDDQLYALYGLPRDALPPVYESWRCRVHPDDLSRTEGDLQRALRGEADYDSEFRIIHPDGSIRFIKSYALVQRNHQGIAQHLIGINYDITDHKESEAAIAAALQEKEVLLQEIHHRVKNNLGIVSSLLQMQSRRTDDALATAILRNSQNRIASIALVHEKLYRSADLAKIDFSQYIRDLTSYLFDSYNIRSSQVRLTTQIDAAVSLDIETAIPCGLIINELVSNALKHAFPTLPQQQPHEPSSAVPSEPAGEIQIKLSHRRHLTSEAHQQTFVLCVGDNGVGLPDDFDINTSNTLGLFLVKGLVMQLRGTLEMNTQYGSEFIITFTRSEPECPPASTQSSSTLTATAPDWEG